MRYIGPFFRMNSLSQKEISGQLFYLSKESIKNLVLSSKCGLLAQVRVPKKSSINDISILNNFSPLLCIYRKASPMFIHSKTSHGFDESSFKKEINPSTNAFMTLSLLELSDYYSFYNKDNRNISSLENAYKYLAKEQLQFYSENLRNNEGLFVNKKNTSDSNSKGYSLVDKDNKFKFSDQAFMMDAYYLYSYYNKSDAQSTEYLNFSNEILSLFIDYKDALYDLSFNENLQILLALNIHFKHSKQSAVKELIIDIGDFLISKFQDKDYYLDSLDDCALFSICLMDSYKQTGLLSFKEQAIEINEKLISLYNSDKNIFIKFSEKDKKELKYTCNEINLYLLCLLMYSSFEDKSIELKPIVSGLFRKFFVNGGLVTSWPDVPTLDEVERYRNLSLRSNDMLDETYFRMPLLPTPKSSGLASIFIKSLTYSKKKDSLNTSKVSFDSNRNMFNFYLIIYLLKDNFKKIMGFLPKKESNKNVESLKTELSKTESSKKEVEKAAIVKEDLPRAEIVANTQNTIEETASNLSSSLDMENDIITSIETAKETTELKEDNNTNNIIDKEVISEKISTDVETVNSLKKTIKTTQSDTPSLKTKKSKKK